MKAEGQRPAKHARRGKEVGLHQVAVWAAGTRTWMITHASLGAGAGCLDVADDCTDSPEDCARQELVAFFLEGADKVALFETVWDTQRKAIAVKVVAFRTLPVFVTQAMTADTRFEELAAAHALLSQINTCGPYHWDTPVYQAMCAEMGLDPDQHRPRFRPPYEALAEALLHAAAADFGQAAAEGRAMRQSTETMLDVLDLMRADRRPDPSVLGYLRKHWREIDPADLPRGREIARLVFSDELLRVEARSKADTVGIPLATIDFLPSRYGAGCCVSIYGFHGAHEADGWNPRYGDALRGIAVEPGAEALASSAWLGVVYRRLAGQGVVFIPPRRVKDYLDTEGVYWIDRWGGTQVWRQARTPGFGERLLWRLKRPPLLVDRELARRGTGKR